MKQKIVVLTGAGISAESGIATFRDSNGLWEGHDVMEVATPEGWRKNPALVLDFYNQRRKQARSVQPNAAHTGLAKLEEKYEVVIVTQNVDDLHERGGSTNVIHLHGQLNQVRSTHNHHQIYDITEINPNGWELRLGDLCPLGSQLRPHIVWFGEAVPMMETAVKEAHSADIFMVVGTSLAVYPAAGLVDYIADHVPKYVIDLKLPYVAPRPNLHLREAKASEGVMQLVKELMG